MAETKKAIRLSVAALKKVSGEKYTALDHRNKFGIHKATAYRDMADVRKLIGLYRADILEAIDSGRGYKTSSRKRGQLNL